MILAGSVTSSRVSSTPSASASPSAHAVGFKFLDALHQADIAFGNEIRNGQAVAAITHGDLRHETQVRGHELRRSFAVLMFLIALREHVFLLLRQHGELLDFGKIAVEALLTTKRRNAQTSGTTHFNPDLSTVDLARRTPDGHPVIRATDSLIAGRSRNCTRVSSISTSDFVDEFPHIDRQFGAEIQAFAADRMFESEAGCVERLAGELQLLKRRAERLGSTSIDRVP